MGNFNIPQNPEFIDQIRMFESTDPAHADLFNAVIQSLLSNDVFLKAFAEQLAGTLTQHIADKENPHGVKQDQVGLDKVDNTSDMEKPVSTAQQAALDELYQQLTAYTRQKIAALINGAPESLDTLKEVSDAIAAHKSVMDALDAAIGKKANQAEMDSLLGTKLDKTGDASNVTATFSQATTRANLTSKEKLSVSLGKIMKWIADLANGAASTLLGTNLTASRALVSDSNGKVGTSSVSSTELGYLAGAKSKIQDQLDSLNTNLSGHTHSNMTGATTSAAGKAGMVPAPAKGAATRYLRSDGTWQVPPDTTNILATNWLASATVTSQTTSGALALLITNAELYIVSVYGNQIQIQQVFKASNSSSTYSISGYSAKFTAAGTIGGERLYTLLTIRGNWTLT